MKTSFADWMTSGTYLPPRLRDFHDQKDVFKAIHQLITVDKHEYAKDVSWVVGQCYVIDIFLWFMAKRGYTLQKSRMPFEFRDLDGDVELAREERTKAYAGILTPSAVADTRRTDVAESPPRDPFTEQASS